MAFCRFCGKELVDGKCDCVDFLNSMGGIPVENIKKPSRRREPFIIPKINIKFNSPRAFFTSIGVMFGMKDPDVDVNNPYERDVPIVPDCVQPEENEVVVKQYDIARLRTRLKFMRAEGRLMVTNRRILFRAAGTSLRGNVLQEHQFNLDEIGGIEIHKDYKFSILSFIGCYMLFALVVAFIVIVALDTLVESGSDSGSVALMIMGQLFGLLGFVPSFICYRHFWFKYLGTVWSCAWFLTAFFASEFSTFFVIMLIIASIATFINVVMICFLPNLVIKIKTKGATGAVVIGSQKSMFRRKTGDDYSGFREVLPWDDTIMAMNELGPMIDDLQKQGDYAIEKWTR